MFEPDFQYANIKLCINILVTKHLTQAEYRAVENTHFVRFSFGYLFGKIHCLRNLYRLKIQNQIKHCITMHNTKFKLSKKL